MTRARRAVASLVGGVAVAALCACATPAPPPATQRAPASWSHASTAVALHSADLLHWWQGFHDEELTQSIKQALAEGAETRMALARVREARAGADVASSVLWPTVNLDAFAGRNKDLDRLPTKPATGSVQRLGLSAQWELDLLGANRAYARASEQQALAEDEQRVATQVLVAAEVATTLFAQRGVVEQLRLADRAVEIAEEGLRLARQRNLRGMTTELDVSRALVQLKTVEAARPLLGAQRDELSHRLAVLCGQMPGRREATSGAIAPMLPPLPLLMPAEWLLVRPDLVAARHQLNAAVESSNGARIDLFPKFTLVGSGGEARAHLQGRPALSDSVFALGLGLVEPIFNAGRMRARIVQADARVALATAAYDRTLLRAVEEVENAYVEFDSASTRRAQLSDALQAAARAREQASALYANGLADYGAYLDTQRLAVASEDALIQADVRSAIVLVSLYRAFGGGIAGPAGEGPSEAANP